VTIHEGLHRDKGELVAVGVGLLVLSALTRADADVRHWSQLPADIHVLPLRVPPGRHTLDVEPLDRDGRPLGRATFETDVPAAGTRLYWFRTETGHSIRGLVD
jgi:hypothetical protein